MGALMIQCAVFIAVKFGSIRYDPYLPTRSDVEFFSLKGVL